MILVMLPLPLIDQLIRRCRALAALDLIFSPDWQYRYYSFNSHWSENELMASMRDGCGDEWWIVFHRDGWAALKGLAHESPAWSQHGGKLSLALQRAFPNEMKGFLTEPAFRWAQTSFAYFSSIGAAHWTCVNDLTDYSTEDSGGAQLLAHLLDSPAGYTAFAADYYETGVDEQIVAEIFELRPIDATIVNAVNPSISLEDISEELFDEIQYPRKKLRLGA
jgi:hypothetical protein